MADNRRLDDFDNWLNERNKDVEEDFSTEKIDMNMNSSNFENDDFVEDNFIEDEDEYREYVDKRYVDEQIRKNSQNKIF